MERMRAGSPMYSRQKSISSTSSSVASPVMSPMHRHVRSGSTGVAGNFRRTQNNAAKVAAQRLARVMAHQPAEDDDDDDDDDDDKLFEPVVLRPRRTGRSPSPAIGRYLADQSPTVRPTYTGRPSILARPGSLIPPIKPSAKLVITTLPSEPQVDHRREKRNPINLGDLNTRDIRHPRSSSVFQDEIDMLGEENENIAEKLQLAEEKCEEAEARVHQLEKQFSSLEEGVALGTHLLSRKGAALQQREAYKNMLISSHVDIMCFQRIHEFLNHMKAVLKAAEQTIGTKNEEATALRLEIETARDEATSAIEHLKEAEVEIKSLRNKAKRMFLTQEQMEEVVLKRCWLARYWKLCVQHGILPEIAEARHEYWSSLAPLPLEVVLSVGQKSREENSIERAAFEDRNEIQFDLNELAYEGSIESMLLVEKGLRELASLKVEEGILLAMAHHRRPNIKSGPQLSDIKVPVDNPNLIESLELTQEECEDVLFKQAWLTYFWRRAKNHGLEEDIVDDRLQFWINQSARSPTLHDLVDVERGLLELRRLGIETQLWEASREVDN